jgi:RimJ/RimL family protein N-acetyltransferase
MSTPLDRVVWPVRTAHLSIRMATTDDAEPTWSYRRLREVNRWLPRAPATFEEHRASFVAPETQGRTLIPEYDGQVAGDLMIRVGDAWSQTEIVEAARGTQAELGWVVHPDHQGRGFGTELVQELIRICFEDLGLRRVTAGLFAQNEASWRLAERVGMRRESLTVRDSLHRSGDWLDGLAYALLVEEWRAGTCGSRG